METTELEADEMKAEVKDLIYKMEALEKRVQKDIATTVKKATYHLKANPIDPHAGLNSMLI